MAGTPIRPQDVEIGQLINAEPGVFFEEKDGHPVYEGTALQQAKAKAIEETHRKSLDAKLDAADDARDALHKVLSDPSASDKSDRSHVVL